MAAGTGTMQLLESIGITLKMTAPPGLIAHSKPVGEVLRGLVVTLGLHVRQTAEGRLVAGADFAGSDPMDQAGTLARGLHLKVQALVKGAETVELDFHTISFRPMPADGLPAVGRAGGLAGLYVAVSHSGITLAPAIGRFAALELLDGERDPLLLPYAPDRLALA